MDTDSNKVTWVVVIVAAVAIMGGLFVKFVPNMTSQMQDYAQGVIITISGDTVDSSSNSDFIYSDPDTKDDTISIVGYLGHKENLIIPEYRKIGLVYYKITSIGDFAFQRNSNLKQLTLGSAVTSIGDYAFVHTALTRVDFPASVTSIGYHTFNYTPISAISFRHRVDLKYNAFTHTNLKNVTLPTGSTYNGNTFDANAIQQVFDPNVMVTVK